jgi:hypothetical protein
MARISPLTEAVAPEGSRSPAAAHAASKWGLTGLGDRARALRHPRHATGVETPPMKVPERATTPR